jgi:flagellar hook-associated protein FlgK
MKRTCPVCKSEFDGRVDKKFCCDQCRNTYNNRLNQDTVNFSRQVNRILKNNRRILFDIYQKNVRKTAKTKLISAGFNFDYLTNIYKTKTGKIYFFCYDMGYINHEEDYYTIVERKEYVD